MNFYLIARESPRHCGVIFGEQIAKMLCFICFMILPTGIERPKVVGNDVFSWLTRMIYATDIPDNLFLPFIVWTAGCLGADCVIAAAWAKDISASA